MAHRTEIIWIERKSDGLAGPARIGRVTFSKSGRSITYGNQRFQSVKGRGFKANYVDVATGEEYWISGCHAAEGIVVFAHGSGSGRHSPAIGSSPTSS